MRNIFFVVISVTFFIPNNTFSQSVGLVQGIVRAHDGSRLPGVVINIEAENSTGQRTTISDEKGRFRFIHQLTGTYVLTCFMSGFQTIKQSIRVSANQITAVEIVMRLANVEECMVVVSASSSSSVSSMGGSTSMYGANGSWASAQSHTESYAYFEDSGFISPMRQPLSTFSADVDTASYSNIRRFIEEGMYPPLDAVRIEEMVNYFPYAYSDPQPGELFSIASEFATCPWTPEHQLLRLGIQAEKLDLEKAPPSNLVFLLDVSGSMASEYKLPLLKEAFKMLVQQLRPVDRVAIVVYAGAAGLVLPSTNCAQKSRIEAALTRLESGGGTAGGQGIELAYATAAEHFMEKGNNRVILATDGDFNLGLSDEGSLVRLIEEKRDMGIFLTVLGFGVGNYKDSLMLKLADHGNGNYAYIDSLLEAEKVLITELGASLHTLAKDVKIQVEFNPSHVKSYRLIGYEKRELDAEDFEDDRKDAGEIGSGHSVTVLYEIEPSSKGESRALSSGLRYQKPMSQIGGTFPDELFTLRLRYKQPDSEKSVYREKSVKRQLQEFSTASSDFQFAAAVAGFGMMLRNSEYRGEVSMDWVLEIANASLEHDIHGYRSDFIDLVQEAKVLQKQMAEVEIESY